MLVFDPASYRYHLEMMMSRPIMDDEWAELQAWLDDMASTTTWNYTDWAEWLKTQIAAGFIPDLSPSAMPITTQVMRWQAQNLGQSIQQMLDNMKPWLEQTLANINDLMQKITDHFNPDNPAVKHDPPARRPEARNDNPPRQLGISPKFTGPGKRRRK
jgi:hypothetical protein